MRFSKTNNNPKVLVIEDNFFIASVITDYLSEFDYDVTVSYTGDSGKYNFFNFDFDIVLLDLVLPDVDGMTLAKMFKEQCPKDDFIPIIIVSSKKDATDKIKGLEYADDYITKPFSNEEMKARVDVLLRISHLQKQLSISKNRYKTLYKNLPAMCLSIDKDGKISDCNLAFGRLCSVTKNDIVGVDIADIFDSDYSDAIKEFIKNLHKNDLIDDEKIIAQMGMCKNQETITIVEISGVHVGDYENKVVDIITLQDITRGIKLEEKQKIARQQLLQSAHMASIGTLASGVAHEINNPLTAILGCSDALLYRIKENEPIDENDLKEYLKIINTETIRCRSIIDNLSRFSNNSEFKIMDVSLLDSLNSAIDIIRSRVAKQRITIKNNIKDDIFIKSDTQQLSRAFLSILTNCLDFCSNGSEVIIDLDRRDDNSRYASISITDNGSGIPPEILPRIFDPFFTTKEIGNGMGLGLSVCHKIIEESGGTVSVKSDGVNGTSVVIEILKS